MRCSLDNIVTVIVIASFLYAGYIFGPNVSHSEEFLNKSSAQTTVEKSVDEILVKQQEMRDTTVLVRTRGGTSSGIIIYNIETDIPGKNKYVVLTNAHATHDRFVRYLRGVDAITGKLKIKIVDTGCEVVVFSGREQKKNKYEAEVIVESTKDDFSLLSFVTKKELPVAKIATVDMLEHVRVFDEIFAMGCQLGSAPSPTVGIISQILSNKSGEKEFIVYISTAQITPGSSGGGLFKKYDDNYYLIGIPYKVSVAHNKQFIPHLAHSISMLCAIDFIDENMAAQP